MAADESKTRLRDEIAALSETVRELRDEVARLRAVQPACGHTHICVGTHPGWHPTWWPGTQIWCNTPSWKTPYNVSVTDTSLSYTTINAAAGAPGLNTQILDVIL